MTHPNEAHVASTKNVGKDYHEMRDLAARLGPAHKEALEAQFKRQWDALHRVVA